MRKYVLLVILLGTGLLFSVVLIYETVITILTITGWMLAFTTVVVSGVFSAYTILGAIEKYRTLRAARKEAEKQAEVMVVTNGPQVFIRDMNSRAIWRAAHLDPRFYANHKWEQPRPEEVQAWQQFNQPKVIERQAAGMLPAQTQVDLLAALDSVQRCLIVGASDVGKTTLLQWLVSRRLNVGRVIVIDPHSWPGKWTGRASVVGTGRDYHAIDRALAALVQLMTRRYDEIGRGLVAEMAHEKVTILIDEWRAITGNLGKPASEAIKALLTESRKAAFSVFVASHSDRAKPLGLEGEYDLKDGFAVVRLTIANGQHSATIDAGDGPIPAVLPGPFVGSAPKVVETPEVFDLEPEPDDTEAEILRLNDAGASVSAIARQVFGAKGGYQNQAVKDVLVKFAGV